MDKKSMIKEILNYIYLNHEIPEIDNDVDKLKILSELHSNHVE